jgi:hypothetical protein
VGKHNILAPEMYAILMVLHSYENNNVGIIAWTILKVSPEMAELILARFLEWVLKVKFSSQFVHAKLCASAAIFSDTAGS